MFASGEGSDACKSGNLENLKACHRRQIWSEQVRSHESVDPCGSCAVIVLHWERRLRTPPRADADRTVTWGADRPDLLPDLRSQCSDRPRAAAARADYGALPAVTPLHEVRRAGRGHSDRLDDPAASACLRPLLTSAGF